MRRASQKFCWGSPCYTGASHLILADPPIPTVQPGDDQASERKVQPGGLHAPSFYLSGIPGYSGLGFSGLSFLGLLAKVFLPQGSRGRCQFHISGGQGERG